MHASTMARDLSNELERPVEIDELSQLLGRELKPGTNIDEPYDEVKSRLVHADTPDLESDEEASDEETPVADAEAPASDKKRRTRSPKKGSVQELLVDYKNKGLTRLTPEDLDKWFPKLKDRRKSLPPSVVLTEAQREKVTGMLDVLVAINNQRLEDIRAREAWEEPISTAVAYVHRPGWSSKVYVYTAICGHEAEITHEEMVNRIANGNAKVPAFYLLCVQCRAVRTALLNLIPGAANPDSVCSVCKDSTFRGRTTEDRAVALAQSRGDLWENLTAGVIKLDMLPVRLNPDHLPTHRKHQQMVQTREQFNEWVRMLELHVGIQITKHPDMGRDLKAHMAATIADRKAELGLDTEED